MTTRWMALVFGALALGSASAQAQQASVPDMFLHGVPAGTATATTIQLSLADAIGRGLDHNLAVILQQSRSSHSEGQRERDLSALLPHVFGGVRQSAQIVNLAAFGFTGFEGVPQVIGPFGVFDARVFLNTPLYDAAALGTYHESKALASAETHADRNIRELVVLAVGSVYLEAVADEARVASSKSQVATAEALARLAEDQRAAGVVAGIDVLRQQVAARIGAGAPDHGPERAREAEAEARPRDRPAAGPAVRARRSPDVHARAAHHARGRARHGVRDP